MVILSRLMNVHEFDMALIENKDLYTQQECDYLEKQWRKEYKEYLFKKYLK